MSDVAITLGMVFYLIGSLLDVASTYKGLQIGLREANPVIRWVLERTESLPPLIPLILFKVFVGAMGCILLGDYWPIGWLFAGGIYSFVGIRNFKLIERKENK